MANKYVVIGYGLTFPMDREEFWLVLKGRTTNVFTNRKEAMKIAEEKQLRFPNLHYGVCCLILEDQMANFKNFLWAVVGVAILYLFLISLDILLTPVGKQEGGGVIMEANKL